MTKKSKKTMNKNPGIKEPLCPGREVSIDSELLDSDTYRRLVGRRARRLLEREEAPVSSEDVRRRLEEDVRQFFEKINLGADFLPAKYLNDGARRAEAVCRIVTPGSLGTGFLIADGNYIMTNNHVLKNVNVAAASTAEFGYEVGGIEVRIALMPDEFFITNAQLDFTIVACDGRKLSDIEPIPLLRDPATVTRHERVNIIQHPKGRRKEIAIHSNRVKEIKQFVVHYETDTEPGSSGSPVFNNSWDLVALHHAGWSEGGSRATNEGVRISAIVGHLLGETVRSADTREGLEAIIGTIADSSPYLGFFDYWGVGEPGSKEIEVPDFTGNPDFADIGFWNIEHFNNSVSDQRINDVADVLSRLSMDVMGLVEVESGALDRLVTALTNRGDSAGYVHLDVGGRQDLAVLYDRDTTTVVENKAIPGRHNDRLNARTTSGKTAFPRAPLFAECEVFEGNNQAVKFIMIVVHLKAFGDSQSRARRRLAAEMLTEIIDDIREVEGLPVVLGGDFNERLDTDVLRVLKESPDLFSMTADDATTDAISYVGRSHRSLIDHILVSRGVRRGDIQGDDAAIVRLDRAVRDFSRDVSDHVPVVFRMIYRDEPIDVPGEPVSPGAHTIEIPKDAAYVDVEFS